MNRVCESEHSIRKYLCDAQSAKEMFKEHEYLMKFEAHVFSSLTVKQTLTLLNVAEISVEVYRNNTKLTTVPIKDLRSEEQNKFRKNTSSGVELLLTVIN